MILSVWVPYCSSDVYTGTRNASELTQNRNFHGHYIIEAIFDDLIKNTGISQADQVCNIITKIIDISFLPKGCVEGSLSWSHWY